MLSLESVFVDFVFSIFVEVRVATNSGVIQGFKGLSFSIGKQLFFLVPSVFSNDGQSSSDT